MKKIRIQSADNPRVFTIFDAPRLDPITVVLNDVGPGAGMLIIECYGVAWSAYWGGMGDSKIDEFLRSCNPGYIVGKMARPRDLKRDNAYLERIVVAVQYALGSVTI